VELHVLCGSNSLFGGGRTSTCHRRGPEISP